MPSKSAFFRDGKIAPNSALDIGNASTTNKDFDPTINTNSTLNKHTKVPVSSPPPFTYDQSPSDLTQTAVSIGLSIGVWNICGWSIDPDQMLRYNVIKACNLDIICLCETFLKDEQIIEVPDYTWFGNNRKSISKRACRGSGGVGILIRDSVLKQYSVASILDKHDGIL